MPFIIGTALVTAGMSAGTQAAAMGFAVGVDALIASAAGTATTAYGAYASGEQQKANLEYNAAVQRNQAIREEQAAFYEAGKLSEEGQRFKARQRVAFAKAGVTGAGTPLLVLSDTADQIARDVQMTMWGGQQRAGFMRSQAGLSMLRGRTAKRAGLIGAGSTLLGGASTAISRWDRMR